MNRVSVVAFAAGGLLGFAVGYVAPRPGSAAPDARAAQAGGSDAVAALETLAAREPADVQARFELAHLLMDLGRPAEAERWLREVLALRPGDPDALLDLSACLIETGRGTDAVAALDQALAARPGHAGALFNKGLALRDAGRGHDAARTWEELLRRDPDHPRRDRLRQEISRLRPPGGAS